MSVGLGIQILLEVNKNNGEIVSDIAIVTGRHAFRSDEHIMSLPPIP